MRFLLVVLVIFSSLLINQVSLLVLGDVGTATSYGPPYIPTACGGNRREQFPPGNLFVSVSEGLWDNGAACGRRYRIRCVSGNNRPCKGGSIDVRVVDSCSTNCATTLLLSNDAFTSISRFPRAKINIEYTRI